MDFPETTERFIAYFDIMGFKDMMYRDGHDKVSEIMDIVSRVVAGKRAMGKAFLEASEKGIVLPVLFSDSILFVSQTNSSIDAFSSIFIASSFMSQMFEAQIPIKGTLAYGKFTADFERSKFFGRPLVDAFLLAEEVFFYGTVLHHSFENYMDKLEEGDGIGGGLLKRLLVPLKGGDVTHYYVEWRLSPEAEDQWESILQSFYTTVSGSTRKYVDNSLKVYGANPPLNI